MRMLHKVVIFMFVAVMQARIDYRILDREREASAIASLEGEIRSALSNADLQTTLGEFAATTRLPEVGFAAVSTVSYDRQRFKVVRLGERKFDFFGHHDD